MVHSEACDLQSARVLIKVNGVYEALGENRANDQRTTFREAKQKYHKALFFIHQLNDAEVFEKIVEATTWMIGWDALVRCYGGDAKVKKVLLQSLQIQYELLQMKSDEKVVNYFTRLVTITNHNK